MAREEAVEAARDLLLAGGASAVTLKAVGERMGVGHANLIHHFGSAARERARAVVTTAVYMAFADGLIGEVLTQMLEAPRDLGRGLAARAIEAVLNEDLEAGGDRS